jgi:hypothetical protein
MLKAQALARVRAGEVERYPGVIARGIIGRRSYKQDTKKKQTEEQREARHDLLRAIAGNNPIPRYGIRVDAPMSLGDDPGADHLDALLCAIQAAWAWTQRPKGFGAPNPLDPLDGWIADPTIHLLWQASKTPHHNRGGVQGQRASAHWA